MNRIWLSMLAITVALLGTVAYIAMFLVPGREADIWVEIAKACIQLVVVVGLGGIVGLVLRSVDEKRDQRRARDERRFAIFQQLVAAYHRLKFVRRNLRTVGLRRPGPERLRPEQLAALREGLTSIVEIDLTLEQVYRELDARSAFSDRDSIHEQLGRLLQYVSGLVEEWEIHSGGFWDDHQSVRVGDLPKLQAFLGPAKDDFRPNAADPMGRVEWIVRGELPNASYAKKPALWSH
jgi:hypothetical protein